MNKSELIEQISSQADISKKASTAALNAFLSITTEALAQKEEVSLVGFGSFKVRERAERKGRNPSNGDPITIKASSIPVFSAGKGLKDAVK